jgi:hypothetical protein
MSESLKKEEEKIVCIFCKEGQDKEPLKPRGILIYNYHASCGLKYIKRGEPQVWSDFLAAMHRPDLK